MFMMGYINGQEESNDGLTLLGGRKGDTMGVVRLDKELGMGQEPDCLRYMLSN